MAYSEYLADRIRERLRNRAHQEKPMMGGLIFMVNEAMCLGVDIDKSTGEDRLMVRVGKLNVDALLGTKGSRAMDFTGKPMRGFLFIGADGFETDEALDFWVDKALEFNALLTSG